MENDQPKNKIGRPEGSMNKLAREAREMAVKTGRLPHEILLDLARGHTVEQQVKDPETGKTTTRYLVPDLETIKDAAKAAAPYFAPKISTVEVIHGVSDDELDRIIALAAAEAGVSVSVGRTQPETEGEAGGGGGNGDDAPQQDGVRRRRTRIDPSV